MAYTSKKPGRVEMRRTDSDSFSKFFFFFFFASVRSKDAIILQLVSVQIFYDAWIQLCQAPFCFIEEC